MKNRNCKATTEMTTALLMAAGMGTRIKPLSQEAPKPLIPAMGIPMIETIIKAIKNQELIEL